MTHRSFFLCKYMKRGDIDGIYENVAGGPRLTVRRIKDNAHTSGYAVEFEGLIRKALDQVEGKPCHHFGYTNDVPDLTRDDMVFLYTACVRLHCW